MKVLKKFMDIHNLDKIKRFCIISLTIGALAERFKAPSWKGGVVKATVSSNLMRSAILYQSHKTVLF